MLLSLLVNPGARIDDDDETCVGDDFRCARLFSAADAPPTPPPDDVLVVELEIDIDDAVAGFCLDARSPIGRLELYMQENKHHQCKTQEPGKRISDALSAGRERVHTQRESSREQDKKLAQLLFQGKGATTAQVGSDNTD